MSGPKVTSGRDNRRRRPKGYAAWRPQAKTRVLLEQVFAVLDEYRDHLPLTVRQVFYRLVASAGYEKTELAYNRLCDHLVRARRARLIPFEWIRDDGITTVSARWHDDVESFWNGVGEQIRGYRRDRQQGQPYRVELWCEATGMAPQLARVADPYSVPVFSPGGGFSSLPAVRLIVDRACQQTVPTVILHVGDFDPSGVSIFETIAADAAAFLEEDRVLALQRLIPERVALTAEHIQQFALPTAPPKESDSRSAAWSGETCQLEALSPEVLAEVVDAAIAKWIRGETLNEQLEREGQDVAELWRGLPRGAA